MVRYHPVVLSVLERPLPPNHGQPDSRNAYHTTRPKQNSVLDSQRGRFMPRDFPINKIPPSPHPSSSKREK
jgi:hypothetical protein